jgi:hypothetical protein
MSQWGQPEADPRPLMARPTLSVTLCSVSHPLPETSCSICKHFCLNTSYIFKKLSLCDICDTKMFPELSCMLFEFSFI